MADYTSAYTGAQIDAGIAKADTATQPGDLATVATTGAYADLTGTPTLGTAAATAATDYATAAQGALADSAVQPGDDANTLGSGAALDGYVLTADGAGNSAWEVSGGPADYISTRSGTTQSIYDMADTWNDGATTFTAIKMNVTDTASAAASLLMDLQVGGVSRFKVGKNGSFNFTNLSWDGSRELLIGGSFPRIRGSGLYLYTGTADTFSFIGTTFNIGQNSGSNVALTVDANHALAQRNGANPQAFNLYNTYTSATEYERFTLKWNGNVLELKPEAAGVGTVREIHISGLPTANPGAGILWNDAGTVKVGT